MRDAVPEELEIIWSKTVSTAFKALEPRRRDFLLEYLKSWNASESYRRAYNPLASPDVAKSNGSRLVACDNIKIILESFLENRTEDLLLIRKTFISAATEAVKPIYGKDELGQSIKIEDIPDHDIRIKGASALAKLGGLNAVEKKEISGNLNVSISQIDELI